MNALIQGFKNFWNDEEGATAVEYGLMVALIAAVIIAAVTLIGTNLNVIYNFIAAALTTAT